MNQYTSTRLMTIEEAQALSDPHMSRETEEKRRQLWAWQTLETAMAQGVSDEAIDKMAALRLRK